MLLISVAIKMIYPALHHAARTSMIPVENSSPDGGAGADQSTIPSATAIQSKKITEGPTQQAESVRIKTLQIAQGSSQRIVHGEADIKYTGEGNFQGKSATACVTNQERFDQSSTCKSPSGFPDALIGVGPKTLQIGSLSYVFNVPLNSDLSWYTSKTNGRYELLIMVCILDNLRMNDYFFLTNEQRLEIPFPICDIKSIKIADRR